jgi:hypothetical protein
MPTTSTVQAVLERLDALIAEGAGLRQVDEFNVDPPGMIAWRTRALAFLIRTFGGEDTYTDTFRKHSDGDYPSMRDASVAVLRNLREDVAGGYLSSFYLGVAGEVLGDLLDIGTWSLGEGSKEAAAILAGTALELGMRRIAAAREVDIRRARGIDDINDALAKASIYGGVRRSQIESWRVLRNHAIHGEHNTYAEADVRLMLEGVRGFLTEELR